MNARLKLIAYASVCVLFVAAAITADAGKTNIKVAVIETAAQSAGPADIQHGQPRAFQVAQCQSGREDCQTRPQAECGPGLDACLASGQTECKNLPPPASGPAPNTAGLDNALKNPNLSPEARARLEKTKSDLEAANQRRGTALGRVQYAQCLQKTVDKCRAAHC